MHCGFSPSHKLKDGSVRKTTGHVEGSFSFTKFQGRLTFLGSHPASVSPLWRKSPSLYLRRTAIYSQDGVEFYRRTALVFVFSLLFSVNTNFTQLWYWKTAYCYSPRDFELWCTFSLLVMELSLYIYWIPLLNWREQKEAHTHKHVGTFQTITTQPDILS